MGSNDFVSVNVSGLNLVPNPPSTSTPIIKIT
jgi:hypothetical protein